MQRRHLIQSLIAGGSLGLAGCASLLGGPSASKAKVLVVGGGYGGATVSKLHPTTVGLHHRRDDGRTEPAVRVVPGVEPW